MTDIVGRLRKQATAVQTLTGNMSSQTIEWLAADEIEILRKDAERYRWLRRGTSHRGDDPAIVDGEYAVLVGDACDRAIDARMSAVEKVTE